jgi:hypothetical protein
MSKDSNLDKILNQVQQKIQGKKPREAIFYKILAVLLAGLILFALGFAGYILAFLIWTYFSLTDVFGFGQFGLGELAFELLAPFIILLVLAYFLYRKTDWPLVRSRKFVIIGALCLCLVFGGSVFALTQNSGESVVRENFDYLQENLNWGPRKENLDKNLDKAYQSGIAVGKVRKIQKSNKYIVLSIDNPKYQASFRTENNELGEKMVAKIRADKKIRIVVLFENKNKELPQNKIGLGGPETFAPEFNPPEFNSPEAGMPELMPQFIPESEKLESSISSNPVFTNLPLEGEDMSEDLPNKRILQRIEDRIEDKIESRLENGKSIENTLERSVLERRIEDKIKDKINSHFGERGGEDNRESSQMDEAEIAKLPEIKEIKLFGERIPTVMPRPLLP